MKRRKFTREFKLAAVNKVVVQGLSVVEVARDLGISDNLIHNWKRAFEDDGTLKATVPGSSSVEEELKRLREENLQVQLHLLFANVGGNRAAAEKL